MKPKPIEVIDYLNEVTGRRFRLTPKHRSILNARIDEGYTLEDFQIVVDKMNRKWGDDHRMAEFVRPITIFGTKMDGYLNSPDLGEVKQKREPSPAEKKRAVGDKWYQNQMEKENGEKSISERPKNILVLRGRKS